MDSSSNRKHRRGTGPPASFREIIRMFRSVVVTKLGILMAAGAFVFIAAVVFGVFSPATR